MMKKNLKLKVTTMCVMVTLLSMHDRMARAGVESDMADMFNSMGAQTNYTTAGAYRSQAANIYTGGGFSAKFGNKYVYPMNIQMPSVNAGCGGIDFFSGAFSFANKEQFIEFTRNLGNNAAGVAFEIGLDALDPLIGGAIDKIRSMVNYVNQNGLNSCQAAKAMVGGLAGKLGESIGKECELTTAADGTTSDNAESRWYCKSKSRLLNQRVKNRDQGLTDLYNTAKSFFTDPKTGTMVQAPTGTGHVNKVTVATTGGNLTLMALNKFPLNAEQKKWLVSIMGTTTFEKPPANADGEVIPKSTPYQPTITAERGADEFIDFFKSKSADKVTVTLWNCHEPGGSSVDAYKATFCEQEKVSYTGFRKRVADQVKILQSAIATGTRPTTSDQDLMYKIVSNSNQPILKMALLDEKGKTNLTDKAIDALTLNFAQAYLAEMASAATQAMSMYETKDESEEKSSKTGIENIRRLQDNIKSEMDAALAKLSNEQSFTGYIQRVESSMKVASPNVSNAINFSRMIAAGGQ